MRLYLVRHGETVLNRRKCYYGSKDVSLSEVGIIQARQVGDMLEEISFDRVISSPLNRAKTTAALILGDYPGEILTDDRLQEQNFGIFEGMTYEEIRDNYPEELDAWNQDFDNYRIPEGESFQDVRLRIDDFLEEYFGEQGKLAGEQGTILLTAHKGTFGHMLASLLGLPLSGYWNFVFDQGCYSCIDIEDGFAIIRKLNACR